MQIQPREYTLQSISQLIPQQTRVWSRMPEVMIFAHYVYLRNEQRVDQVLARDFSVSTLPASCSWMIVTTVQKCTATRRSRHFGMQQCASL